MSREAAAQTVLESALEKEVATLFDRTFAVSEEERRALLEGADRSDDVLTRTRCLLDAATALTADASAPAPVVPSAPPERLGRYEISGVLGQGGFGIVYSGRDTVLKRPVAIKICLSDDPDLRRNFVHEAEISAGLQHPNVVTIFDFGVEDDLPFLVQELLTGEDMADAIRDRPAPRAEQIEDRLRVLVGAADGLAHAHRQGVVHRDIKPSNVYLTDAGEIKLLDFGIAQILHRRTDVSSDGSAAGTVGYLAPEQLSGETVGRPADVFSFGALAFEWLSGERAFPGDSFAQVGYRLLFEAVDPEPLRRSGAPEPLVELVLRCLEKEPEARFADGGELVDQLREVSTATGAPEIDSASGEVPGDEVSERARVVGWKVAAAGIGAILGVILFLAGGAGDPVPEADPASVDAARVEVQAEPPSAKDIPDPPPSPPETPKAESMQRVQRAAPAPPTAAPPPSKKPSPEEPSTEEPIVEPAPTEELDPPSNVDSPAADADGAEAPEEASPPPATPTPETTAPEKSAPERATAETSATETPSLEAPTAGAPPGETVTEPTTTPHYNEGDPGVTPPQVLEQPPASYPRRARRRHIAAQVVVGVLVDLRGRVVQTVLERRDHSGLGFNEAAEEAASQARFEPATRDGVPGTMWTRLVYDFQP